MMVALATKHTNKAEATLEMNRLDVCPKQYLSLHLLIIGKATHSLLLLLRNLSLLLHQD